MVVLMVTIDDSSGGVFIFIFSFSLVELKNRADFGGERSWISMILYIWGIFAEFWVRLPRFSVCLVV